MPWPKGKKRGKEFAEKLRKANFGKSVSQETRRRISISKSGELNPSWKGGRIISQKGYVLRYNPSHPSSDSKGYVREHRVVMEERLGRCLKRGEVVHHKNGDIKDNRAENLELFSCNGEHIKTHRRKTCDVS